MRRTLLLIIALFAGTNTLCAQEYPARPITIIDPAAPGGVSDIAARIVGEALTAKWGQQVLVENRPGAGGSIGVGYAARSKPDGHTLLMTTNGQFAVNPSVYPSLPYDPDKDFIPVALLTNNPMLLVANADAKFGTLPELIAAAKANPGKIGWASPGVGTWNHLAGEWLQSELGIKLLHVPYRGGGPAGVAVAGGDVPVGLIAISSAMPHIKSGRMKVLALSTKQRSSVDSSWPTVAETAAPRFDAATWVGLFVQAATPKHIVRKIEDDVLEIMSRPDIKARFNGLGIEVMTLPSDRFSALIKSDQNQVKAIIEGSGLSLKQ